MQDIRNQIIDDFQLSDYEQEKILATNSCDKIFSSFLDCGSAYSRFFKRDNYKQLLDKYNNSTFSLPIFLWEKIKNNTYHFERESLKSNLIELVPYIKADNTYFNSFLTHSYYCFNQIDSKSVSEYEEKNKKLDYLMLNSLIKYNKLEFDNQNYIDKIIIPIISRGDTQLLKILHDKYMVKLDKKCIQKCLYYGRYRVLEFLILHYEETVCDLLDKDILDIRRNSYVDDIWGGMYWHNDECDKPVFNCKEINHIKTFSILQTLIESHSIKIDFTSTYFRKWYEYVNYCNYSPSLDNLFVIFSVKFEKNRQGVKTIYDYTGNKNITMEIVNTLFTPEELFDLVQPHLFNPTPSDLLLR